MQILGPDFTTVLGTSQTVNVRDSLGIPPQGGVFPFDGGAVKFDFSTAVALTAGTTYEAETFKVSGDSFWVIGQTPGGVWGGLIREFRGRRCVSRRGFGARSSVRSRLTSGLDCMAGGGLWPPVGWASVEGRAVPAWLGMAGSELPVLPVCWSSGRRDCLHGVGEPAASHVPGPTL